MKCVDNIASLLNSVLRWLESEDEDEKWWQLQTQVVQLCLLELDMKLRARSGKEEAPEVPGAIVVPNVRSMVTAMQERDRAAAQEMGLRALSQLNGSAT
jgi:hypothetical protein